MTRQLCNDCTVLHNGPACSLFPGSDSYPCLCRDRRSRVDGDFALHIRALTDDAKAPVSPVKPVERCPSVGPFPERFRCGLPAGHDGSLIETSAPWFPADRRATVAEGDSNSINVLDAVVGCPECGAVFARPTSPDSARLALLERLLGEIVEAWDAWDRDLTGDIEFPHTFRSTIEAARVATGANS